MLSRLLRVAGATVVALAALFAAPAFANVKTVNGISVETSLTQITRGQPYSYQITPSGPSSYSGSYTFSVIGGSLPTGISVSSSGLVSGVTCDTNGSNKFDLRISTTGAPATTADFSGNSDGMSVNVTTSGAGVCDLTMTGSAPNGTVGTVYGGGSFVVSGGTSPYTYDLFSGTLPPGLALNSNGTLTGTPTTAGTYTFVVRGRDTILRSGMATYTVTIIPAAPVTLTVNPTTLPGGQTTVAYSQSFSVSNGTGPYSYAVSAGALPAGLTLAGGTLSGTPTMAGTYNFTVQATDSLSNTGTRAYTVVIAGSSTITIAPMTLPGGAKSTLYSQTVVASGGTAPYTWSIPAGALPPGLSLSSSTGAITGTPTSANTFNFTVRALDANGNFGTRAYTVVIAAATITIAPASLPNASNGVPYNQAITASGGTAPYSYALGVGSTLPTGVTLASDGTLSGTPTSAGSFNFTVVATDSLGDTGSRAYTLVVDPANIVLLPSSLPNVATGTPVNTTFTATGGTGPYTYASSGTLPPGLTLSTGGTLSGTPTVPGTYTFDITVTDAHGDTKTVSFSFTIDALPLSIDPPTLPNAKNGMAYSESFIGSGGITPYTFAMDSSTLPNGLTLASDGTLSGTPAATAGSYNFTIRLNDAVLGSTTRSYTLVVESASMGIAPASLPDATTGVAYSQQLFTTGGTGPYTYTFTGTLPTGLTLSTSGLVSGTPTAAGTYAFDVTATDSNGDTAFKSYSITVAFATVSVDPATLPDGTNGTAYSATFTASGGTAPYTYAISGSAPAGLALAGDTLSGTPAGAGSYTFTITATDNFGATGTRSYTVSIASATLVVSPSSLPGATNGAAYSQALSTSGGTAPYSYASTTLPSGLTLSSAGVLSGTPNVAAGSYSFDVTVIDDNGDSTTVTYSLVIGAATIAVDPATLPGGANGAAYNATFTANGGTAPYTYAATGTPPTGLSFSGDTLSGTPTAAGSYTFTITATDANGDTGSRGYTVVVDAATLVVSPSTLPAATNGAAYTQALSTSGGAAPYTYVSTTLPAGLTLSSAGVLSGTPNVAAGSYSFDVTVTDDNGDSTTVTYSLVVNAATIAVDPATLPGGANSAAYTATFTASGGTAPYTYAATGALPTGLSFAGATLSGTPTAAGLYTFTITATDANGDTGANTYTLVIASATIDVTPASLPGGTNGAAYDEAFAANGGTAPYTYAHVAGTLPSGLVFNGTALAGTPTAAGSYNFSIEATDANGDKGTRAYTLVVGAATVTVMPATLPGSSNGQPYSQDFAATGGTAPYTYALVAGTLPNGLALANGKLAGTPSAAGDYGFTVEATDANGDKGARAYAVAIAAATIAIAPDALADGTNGTAFSQAFTATGGTAPYTFALASGTLPTGLALAANGTLAGTPTATGDFTFTIEATDANGDTASHAYAMAIAGGDLLIVNPETLPGGNAEEAYAQTLSAIGGNGPYTFAVTEGALPEGLALAADGKLTGTPTDAGETTFTVTATDADGNFGTRAYALVFAEAIVLDITPGTLEEGRGGSPYEATFGATGGTAPYTFTVADGTVPPGMTLSSNGTLSGTPTTPGSYTFTVRGEDNLGHAGTRSFTLVIGAALRADPTRDPGVIDSVNEQLNAARRLGELQMSHVFRRIDAPRAPCAAAEGESSESCKTPVEVWATGTRETSFASGLAVVNAFTVGADMQAGPVRIGAALGTGSDLTERASGYRGDVDGKTWMLYGRIALGDTFGLSAVAGRTDVDIDSRRVLTDAGVAVGRRDGDTEFVGVEVSGEWGNGERGLVPYLRWEHARTELGGYAEAANSPLALQFAGVSQRNSAFVLGAEAFHVLRFNWGTLTPKVRVEVRDRNGSSVGQALWYSDAPGTPYLLSVRGVDDRSALAALGLEAAFGAVKVSLEYGTAGSAEDLFEGQAVRLQLRADF